MASAPLRISCALQCFSSDGRRLFGSDRKISYRGVSFPWSPISGAAGGISFSGRRPPSTTSMKIRKKKLAHADEEADEDIDEDAFEALFQQLEEDLKNDEIDGEDLDLGEEELAQLEKELAEAFGDDELLGDLENQEMNETDDSFVADDKDSNEAGDESEEYDTQIKLKNWQLRRLATALKNGRRKTGIKGLAAELCLDRAIVLKLLRDPPPSLVMMSAALPDRPPTPVASITTEQSTEPLPAKEAAVKQELPVHVMQSNWIERKRLKKVHLETLERVYLRTKRPTNAMISSIVHVTNLPRRKVLKWFEDKRAAEGVPDRRIPYQRSPTESVFST